MNIQFTINDFISFVRFSKASCRKINSKLHLICFFFCFLFCISNLMQAQPTLAFKEISNSVSSPVAITNAADGTGRLFIAEGSGKIKIYKNGSILSQPFLDISLSYPDQIISAIAFHPKYKKNRLFFVYSYNATQTTITLRSFMASVQNPDSAVLSSAKTLFSKTSPSSQPHHVMGDMHFGKDGYLYLSLGDGSPISGLNNQAQNGQLLFGKMLRIDVNETNPPYYKIPVDNPFVNDPNVLDEIWSIGLRNAWRWSFDRKTGDLWIGDVGKESWEEVDFMPAGQSKGKNFGWNCYEGNADFDTAGCGAKSNYVFPIFTYADDILTEHAVIGGYVYRGLSFPKLKGYYVCVDYASLEAWKIKPNGIGGWQIAKQANIPKGIAGFGEGEDAELYAISYDSNKVYQVQTFPVLSADDAIAQNANVSVHENAKTNIYPTLVTGNTITIELKDTYSFVRLVDMNGHELLRKSLTDEYGSITLNLPKLQSGMYIIQLTGKQSLQQKIYVTQ